MMMVVMMAVVVVVVVVMSPKQDFRIFDYFFCVFCTYLMHTVWPNAV